ncbi:MAG: MBL fold metallo-hydrolase [Oscillospiraceae bacterium]|nr:MBL fold metallo-hydrolase [Oscillospiraceae bacterium]
MKLYFYGADKAVTGSCHCVEAGGQRLLVDCGLQQGGDEREDQRLPFPASGIDYVIATHAHIDHTGRIPLLVKDGFRGSIHASRLTGELMSIMLRDSAYIQESDAKWENQKGRRAGRDLVQPLYTVADAEAVIPLLESCEYGERVTLSEVFSFRLIDAGHLLGSAFVEVWVTEEGVTKKLLFSGDIGNVEQPIIRDPQPVEGADYVVMESTYGDRNHEPMDGGHVEDLAWILEETFQKGGNVVIPAFAVGRTQEILYFLREVKERNLVPSNPNFMVCVDSPLAAEATQIFSGNLDGYLDEEALKVLEGGRLFDVSNLHITHTSEESRMLNLDKRPKVIISASGMCDAGRIRHHLKHNLWREECTVLFVGFQAVGSLGRALLEGKQSVHLFGEDVMVRAKIVNFKGMSSHADRDHLLAWVGQFEARPDHVFVVHGEAQVAESFAQALRNRGLQAHAPEYTEIYDLAANRVERAGVPAPEKPASKWQKGSPAYRRLEEAGRLLLEVIRQNKGGTNKDLGKFADQILALVQKWTR